MTDDKVCEHEWEYPIDCISEWTVRGKLCKVCGEVYVFCYDNGILDFKRANTKGQDIKWIR